MTAFNTARYGFRPSANRVSFRYYLCLILYIPVTN